MSDCVSGAGACVYSLIGLVMGIVFLITGIVTSILFTGTCIYEDGIF